MLVRDVKCPKCGAGIDWPCTTSGGYRGETHKARWNAAGIGRPTTEQRSENYRDGIRRDGELAARALDAMAARMKMEA